MGGGVNGGDYIPETFTAQERALLSQHFTNTDLPVFALMDLPEVTKGALFARYSRSAKSLRRLYLDEFASSNTAAGRATKPSEGIEGTAASEALYKRVFVGFGDDSVAQLGGAHLACEGASQILTKILERGRIGAYLEQSTRYVPFAGKDPAGRYRYLTNPGFTSRRLADRYRQILDGAFEEYSRMLEEMVVYLQARFPQGDTNEAAWRRSVRAGALDCVRGLLPAATQTNVGIYASGQSFEALLVRMRTSDLPEVRWYADLILGELRKIIPSFLERVDRDDRGVAHSQYLTRCRQDSADTIRALLPATPRRAGRDVELVDFDPDGETKVLAAIAVTHWPGTYVEAFDEIARMGGEGRKALMDAYVGERMNRRHRPGRAFEATCYRFEIVSDYGAFRDLQRHRMLTCEWQPLDTRHGYQVPSLVDEAGLAGRYRVVMGRCADLHDEISNIDPELAKYAVPLGYRMRYSLGLNAREAMHLCELRSAPGGHPAYQTIAVEMHRQIRDVAGHRLIAAAMSHVHNPGEGLGRVDSETRAENRREEVGGDH